MPSLDYRQPNLVLKRGGSQGTKEQIRQLQRDFRRLGYLKNGIDGAFGKGTERAVKALQHDLLNNDGSSTGNDGSAPVSVLDYNRGRVVEVTGVVDQLLVECIFEMLTDGNYIKLPHAENPAEENRKFLSELTGMASTEAPLPFLLAILKQESGLKHFHEPAEGDEDTFIVVGLDTNSNQRRIITSRGYGAGQYTLFHHPPRSEEVKDFMLDPAKNLHKAITELRNKFDHFVNGSTSGTRADDRHAEFKDLPLRTCKYSSEDPRYLNDCQTCGHDAGLQDIQDGVTPLYKGSQHLFRPTQYYKKASYRGVPIREKIGCDWPYAVRRYNGAGINSYHYQVRVLKNLLRF